MKSFLMGLSTFVLGAATLSADEGAAPAAQSGNMMQTFIMIGLALVFFYFILWRPEQKRRKALEKQRSSMKKGDKVTAMGIIGTIDKIQDKSVILKMVDGSKIEVISAAITEVQPGSDTESKRTELPTVESDKK